MFYNFTTLTQEFLFSPYLDQAALVFGGLRKNFVILIGHSKKLGCIQIFFEQAYIGELELTMKGDPFLGHSLWLLSIWHLHSLFSLVFLPFFFFFFFFFVLTSLSLLQFITYESLSWRFLFSRYNLPDCSNSCHMCGSHVLATSYHPLQYIYYFIC